MSKISTPLLAGAPADAEPAPEPPEPPPGFDVVPEPASPLGVPPSAELPPPLGFAPELAAAPAGAAPPGGMVPVPAPPPLAASPARSFFEHPAAIAMNPPSKIGKTNGFT